MNTKFALPATVAFVLATLPVLAQNIVKDSIPDAGAVFKDGKLNGIVKMYYESGKLRSETPYVDCNKNGISKSYYEDGKLSGEILFANNNPNGVAKSYYENGKIESEITFVNGKMIRMTDYNKRGKVKFTANFANQ